MMHGEEARIILDDYFAEVNENGEMNNPESSGQFEAGCTFQHNEFDCIHNAFSQNPIRSLPILWQDTDGVLFEPLPESGVDAIPQREATEAATSKLLQPLCGCEQKASKL